MHPESTLHDPRRKWLAAALRGERPAWNDEALGSVEELLEVAEYEGVAALIDAAVRRAGSEWPLPAELGRAFADVAREQVALELMRRTELMRVVQALHSARISALLLKGSALAYACYPQPHLRPRIDIDLLVGSPEDAERCKSALATIGYAASQASTTAAIGYELVLHRTAQGGHLHWIDVHWALANQALYADAFAFDALAADAIAIPPLGEDARGLGPVHALLHACMHRISNLPTNDGDRLIWLYDMDLLARRFTADDFEHLRELAQQRGLAGACWDGLRTAEAAFATPLPAGWLDALERIARSERFDVRKARKRWYQEWHNLRALPMRRRLSLAREKLFPDPTYMYAREHDLARNRRSLLFAYLRRLGNGLRMALRGRAS